MSKDESQTSRRRPGRPRSQRARKAALDAAYVILREEGFGRVTVEAVAASAGIGKPTIYRHWSNARELAMAALMERSISEQTDGGAAKTATPVAQIEALMIAMAEQFQTPAGRQVALMMASAEPGSELAKSFRNQVMMKSRNLAGALLQQAMDEGELRADLDAETTLDLLFGPVFYRLLTRHAPIDAAFCKSVLVTCLTGLQNTAPGQQTA